MDPPAGPEKGSGPPSYQSLSYLLETGIREKSQKRKREKKAKKSICREGALQRPPWGVKIPPPEGGVPKGKIRACLCWSAHLE